MSEQPLKPPTTEAEAEAYRPGAQRRVDGIVFRSCQAADLTSKTTWTIRMELYEGVIKMFGFEDHPRSELSKLYELVINACERYDAMYPTFHVNVPTYSYFRTWK